MTIKQQGGIFGRNPTFNDVEVDGSLSGTTVDLINSGGSTQTALTLTNNSTSFAAGSAISFKFDSDSQEYTQIEATPRNGVQGKLLVKNLLGGSLTQALTLDGVDLSVDAGNLVIGTSGQGIDFSATSGTGTSELFDDYEEGTFTPNIGGTTPTYTHQRGRYTKIGRMVHAAIDLSISNRGDGSFNRIYGLPFTVSNNSLAFSAAVSNWTDVDQSFVHLSFIAEANATSLLSYGLTAGGATTTTAPVVFRTTSSQITLNVVYEAA